MLYPEDWKEYEWNSETHALVAVPTLLKFPERKLWRVHATAGGTPGTLTILGAVTTVPANATVVLEPLGMAPFVLVYDDCSLIVESIARVSPT